MLAYLLLYALLSLAAGHLGEMVWGNWPWRSTIQFDHTKPATFKCLYGFLALGVIATQGLAAPLAILAGLPVFLAHLSLIRQKPFPMLTGRMIASHMWEETKRTFREFINPDNLNDRR